MGFYCRDCGFDTLDGGEYYAIHDDLWMAANGQFEGMLCIWCLEERLGRQLTADDFPDCDVNRIDWDGMSETLVNRLLSHA